MLRRQQRSTAPAAAVLLPLQLRGEVSDDRLVHVHDKPRGGEPADPLRHVQPHLPRRVDIPRLHPPVREERERHVALRAVGAGPGRVHLRRVLAGRRHGREQRGGRLDHRKWRRRGGEAVQAGRHEPWQLPAGPGQPVAGPGHHAHRGAVVSPLPRVPVHRSRSAHALPHLRRGPLRRAPLRRLPRPPPQLLLRRRQLRHRCCVQRGRGVVEEQVARRDGRPRVGRADAGGDRAGALLQAPRPLLVLRARLRPGRRLRARRGRRRRRVQAPRRRRSRRRHTPGARRRRPRLRMPPGAGVLGAAGQGVQGEEILELVPPLRRPCGSGLRRGQRLHRTLHRARVCGARGALRHLPRRLGLRLGCSRDQALEDRLIHPLPDGRSLGPRATLFCAGSYSYRSASVYSLVVHSAWCVYQLRR